MAVNAKNITDDEFFFGHKACAGCGGSLAVRAALKVLGPNAVCALPAGCMSAVGFNFPQLSFANNAMIDRAFWGRAVDGSQRSAPSISNVAGFCAETPGFLAAVPSASGATRSSLWVMR